LILLTITIAGIVVALIEVKNEWNKKTDSAENPVGSNSTDNDWHIDGNVYVWTDEETGVQYLIYSDRHSDSGMGGITPRLNADGTICVVDDNT